MTFFFWLPSLVSPSYLRFKRAYCGKGMRLSGSKERGEMEVLSEVNGEKEDI